MNRAQALLADLAGGAWAAAERSAVQFAFILGAFAASAFALTWLAKWAGNLHRQFLWPRAPLLLFGSIGVPAHELGHALFCLLFGHEVRKIKWFDAKGRGGAHGAVEHAYSPGNPRHRVGQFFIGIGPTILGPALIALLFVWLAPSMGGGGPSSLLAPGPWWKGLAMASKAWATAENWRAPSFWIFVYLAAAIASQAELSREDLAQARTGAVAVALALLAVNAVASAVGWIGGIGWALAFHENALRLGESAARVWTTVAGVAVVASAGSLALTWAAMSAIHLAARRELPNPFRAR